MINKWRELRDAASEGPAHKIWCDVIIDDKTVFLGFLTIKQDFHMILKSDF